MFERIISLVAGFDNVESTPDPQRIYAGLRFDGGWHSLFLVIVMIIISCVVSLQTWLLPIFASLILSCTTMQVKHRGEVWLVTGLMSLFRIGLSLVLFRDLVSSLRPGCRVCIILWLLLRLMSLSQEFCQCCLFHRGTISYKWRLLLIAWNHTQMLKL